MTWKIKCLGIAAGFASAEYNTQSYLLTNETVNFLFDASEGAAELLKNTKLDVIFISHRHMDHISGLPQIILNHINNKFQLPEIFVPEGGKQFLDNYFSLIQQEIAVQVIDKDTVIEIADLVIRTVFILHEVTCYGVRIQSKDKLFYVLSDGKYADLELDKDEVIDCLIGECTFNDKEKAEQYWHSDDSTISSFVSKYQIKSVYLGHFSLRYQSYFQQNIIQEMGCFKELSKNDNVKFLCQGCVIDI